MRRPEEHLEQAERYADGVLAEIKILADAQTAAGNHALGARVLPLSRDTIALSEMLLHAADIELKLAVVKSG
jgi:hypothetical protein